MQKGTRVRDLATGLTGTVIEQDPPTGTPNRVRFTLDEQPEKATADEPDHTMWSKPHELAVVEHAAGGTAAEPSKDAGQGDAKQGAATA